MTTALLYDPIFALHDTGEGHPESPMRYTALVRALEDDPKAAGLPRLTPRPATQDELELCHSPGYVDLVYRRIQAGAGSLGFPDTNVGPGSWEAACRAAGGAMAAVDAVFEDRAQNVFCVLRPPGHHALPTMGMGFCVFNNIALAARHAQQRHGISRILIVDWDVHHGNGTQDIFYEDGSVLFFSTHQRNWYPHTGRAEETGAGPGLGLTINCLFPAGTGGEPILAAFREKLLPAAQAFKPELVLISAGFDALASDPLGGLRLVPNDFADLTDIVLDIAQDNAKGRVVSLLEGGYDLQGLCKAALAHVHALL